MKIFGEYHLGGGGLRYQGGLGIYLRFETSSLIRDGIYLKY